MLLFWHHAVLGNKQLVLLVGCPRQGPTLCCSSGVAKAKKENLREIIRPETLSLGCDKVSEHQQASTIQFCLKTRKVLEPRTSTTVSVRLGECRIVPGMMLPCTEAAPSPLGFWSFQMANKSSGVLVFFAPEHNALPFFYLIGFT